MESEDDGRGAAAGKAMVTPPPSISPPYSVYPKELWKIRLLEDVYLESGEHQWSNDAIRYYRDYLNETEKDQFLKVPASDLAYLCRNRDPSWLRNMLTDAETFFKLHNKWEVYICPSNDCFCWFSEADSLVLHLMNEHCNAWPSFQWGRIEEHWRDTALWSAVWEPIDVEATSNALLKSSLYCTSGCEFLFASSEWPLSKDFQRKELLAELRSKFLVLLNSRERDSITLCSRALIGVASEEVCRRLERLYPKNVLPLSIRNLLYFNALSFRFMEAEPLCSFLKLVEGICDFIEDQASQNRESEVEGSQDGDMNWSQNNCFDAVSFPADCDYFVLDVAKLKLCGIDEQRMGSWLFEMPIFPTISKLPTRASVILQHLQSKAASFSKCLTQYDLKVTSLTNCLKIWNSNMGHWPTPLFGNLSSELASNSESDTAKQWITGFDYQHYLELIKLTSELQFFELEVRRFCAVDLRAYILPLLRSYLRMKLYMFIRIGSWTEDVKEEDAGVGHMMEGSQEENPEEHVHSKVKGEPAAEDGIDVMTPDLSSYKRSEELSTSPPELGSSGSSEIGISDLDPMMIDGGEALGGEPSVASAVDTDSSASQVGSADAALSRSKTGIATAIAESKAKPEALPESDAEPESQWSQEFQGPPCCESDMYFDSDMSESEGESENEGHEMEEFSDAFWFMKERSALETKDNGLFVCMTINDVVKHCLEKKSLDTALTIWGLKTNRTLKYWRCFHCDKVFPDQKSHMWHIESKHGFGLSLAHGWLVPPQVWEEGQSVVNEGVKERTHSLDESITVDCAYRTFLVEMEKFGSPLQNKEEGKDPTGELCNTLLVVKNLVDTLDTSCKLLWTSETGERDTEIVLNLFQFENVKQKFSGLCVSDYKTEVLRSISSFLEKRKLMDRGIRSWALRRLNDLLLSVRCDSLSIKLTSPGKVIINIEEHNAVIGFSYIGICWEFTGDLSFEWSRNIKGTFMFSGASTRDGTHFDNDIILDEESKMTTGVFHLTPAVEMDLTLDLLEKLHQFQAEFRRRLQG